MKDDDLLGNGGNATTELAGTARLRLDTDLDEVYKKGNYLIVPADQLLKFLTQLKKVTVMPKKDGTAKELICKLIKAGKTDEQILDEVANAMPESAADKKHCTKYRREVFVEIGDAGLAAVGSDDHKDWAVANMALAKKGPHKAHWIAKEKAEKDAAAAAKKKVADEKKAAADKKKADAAAAATKKRTEAAAKRKAAADKKAA